MGLVQSFAQQFGINLSFATNTKQPSFYVSEFVENTDYTKLLESDQYFDQYIGYTYLAVNRKAGACARVEPRLYRKTTRSKTEEVPFEDSQLLKDLYNFNEEQTLNDARFLIHLHLGLTGIAFIYMADGLYSKDYYILNPERFSVIPGKNGLPVAYKFEDSNGDIKEIPRANLLIFRHPNPKNWLKGWSPVFASKYAHNSWEYSMQLNMNTFANQGKMQGILSFLDVSEPERKRIERSLRDKYSGTKNAGKIMVTDNEPRWTPMTNNLKDLEYIEGIKLMREEILSIQGVPEPLALSSSTYNNVEHAERIFAKYTIDPLLALESSVYTEQLIPRYYPKGSTEAAKSYIEFPSTIPVDETKVSLAFEKGISKLNEARRQLSLDDDPINGEKYMWELQKPDIKPTTEKEPDVKKIEQPIAEKQVVIMQSKEGDASDIREELRLELFNKTISQEEGFLKTTKQLFKEQGKRVLDNIKKSKAVESAIDIDLSDEVRRTVEIYALLYPVVAEAFNEQANDLLGKEEAVRADVLDQLIKELATFSEQITKTTQSDLLDIANDAVENNLGLEETTVKVKELFDRYANGGEGISQSRAELIARDRTNDIKLLVTYERYMRDEDVEELEWLATGGKGSRDDHNKIDGKTVKKGEDFIVGGEKASRPRDSRLSKKQKIGCRCDLLPRLKK